MKQSVYMTKYLRVPVCLTVAFISTYFIKQLLKSEQNNYMLTNSLLSLFICCGIFALYMKVSEKIEARLWVISAFCGIFFSTCMVVGRNVLLYDQTRINHPKVWVYILAETPLFMAAVIIIFRTLYEGKVCLEVRPLDRFLEQKVSVKTTFFFAWAAIFLAWIPGLLAAYPGIYGYDSIYQLTYYTSGEISLHHPLIHTYLLGFCVWTLGNFFGDLKLGLLIYSLIQMVCLSGALACICTYMAKKKCPGIIRIIFLLFFMLFPTNAIMSFSATKDVLYTAFLSVMIVLFTYVADKPELLKKNSFFACIAIFIFLQIIFRSQGIYVFVFGMIFGFAILRKYWKRLLALFLVCLILYAGYSGPITALLNGQESDSIHEMMSVPCVQLSKAVLDNAELTEEEKEKVREYIPNYEAYYDFESNADALKNTFNSELFKENPWDFIKLWMQIGLKAPMSYIDAFARITIGLWYPDMNYRDLEAWHPYWEYESSKQLEEDIDRVIVDRDTPEFMQGLSEWYYRLSYENSYQNTPVISMLFSSGFVVWILCLYVAWCIYTKQYKYLVPASFAVGVWLTTILGPVVLYRYIYPITIADTIFLSSVLSMKEKGDAENG